MNLFAMLDLSASAMTAERQRAEVVASNMANTETTPTPDGGPYQRKLVVFQSGHMSRFPRLLNALYRPNGQGEGVKVAAVVNDPSPAQLRYDPSHPDANAQGYVAFRRAQTMFKDLFYQTIGSSGGGDPIQVGAGTAVGKMDANFTPGSTDSTGVDTDVAIGGDGFFVVQKDAAILDRRFALLA